jgi:hypothetical protein
MASLKVSQVVLSCYSGVYVVLLVVLGVLFLVVFRMALE